MKAVVLHGKENVTYSEFADPVLTEDSVKISVTYCGICGSDLHKFEGKKNTHPIHYPVPLGHEISGYVTEVGKHVKNFQIGDKVTVDPNWSCGACSFCQKGMPSFCRHARGVVKGMAEYVVSPAENVYLLPQDMDMKLAALAEPVSCCLHGMDLLNVRVGDTVGLIGFGAIGAIMLRLIRFVGASRIIVIEPNAAKRDAALAMGADLFFTDISQINDPELNVDRVIECVGIVPAQEAALSLAGKGATVVLFGVGDEKDRLPLSTYEAFLKELTIKTSFVNPHTTERAIRLLSTGVLHADELISRVILPEEVPAELSSRTYCRQGKVLVQIHGER